MLLLVLLSLPLVIVFACRRRCRRRARVCCYFADDSNYDSSFSYSPKTRLTKSKVTNN